MITTKTEKEEEEDQKRLSRPSCLIVGESTRFSGKKVLKTKKTKKKRFFFSSSVCFFLAWTALFLVVLRICLLYTSSKQERESARERTKAKHFCVIYIYTYI